MQMYFYFDQTRCTGCSTCVVACKNWHGIPAGPSSWIEMTSLESGVYPHVSLSHMFNACWHCAEPACVKACPASAIIKRQEDGITTVDGDACIGGELCRFACLRACPYKIPQFGLEPNPKMQKCGLCLERWSESKRPICVEACPMRALDAGPEDELKARFGSLRKAEGFVYTGRLKPSVIFRPKPSGETC